MAPSGASTPNPKDDPSPLRTEASLEAASPSQVSPDLCVDCFRGDEQLVMALLDSQAIAKARPGTQVSIAGWHGAEMSERRRGNGGVGEDGGGGGGGVSERRRRPIWGSVVTAVETFQHHADVDTYIREYRRRRDEVLEAGMQNSRKKENDNSGK